MGSFNFTDLTDLENAKTKEALKTLFGRVLEHSETVKARVEELTFETGEYAVVFRGVLRRPDGAEEAPHDKGGAAIG
jgi:hypothetical protein